VKFFSSQYSSQYCVTALRKYCDFTINQGPIALVIWTTVFISGKKILIVRVMSNCSLQEFEAIHDGLALAEDVQVHDWCLFTGNPGSPSDGELFNYAYVMAHGDALGCNFCDSDDMHCRSMQGVSSQLCEFLAPQAVVIAACCGCGNEGPAAQIACGCSKVGEVIGPDGVVIERDMHQLAARFFKALSGECSPLEASKLAGRLGGIGLAHSLAIDIESDCEP